MRFSQPFAVLLAAASLVCASRAADAASYEFTTVVDTSGQFSSLGYCPSINDAGQVVFAANLRTGGAGLYLSDAGALTTLDFRQSGYTMNDYGGDPVINDAGEVAFIHAPFAGIGDSVYKWSGGTLTTIAGTSSMSSVGPFGPAINNSGTVVFRGISRTTGKEAIYLSDGAAVTTIVDTLGSFAGFGTTPVINDSGTIGFAAVDKATNKWGIYTLAASGLLTLIADTSGSIADFTSANLSLNDSGTVAFLATLKSGGPAIFRGNGSSLDMIVDATGPFTSFNDQPVVNNSGDVGFVGTTDSGQRGIYTGPDPTTDSIIQVGDSVGGSVLTDLLAFGWGFTDNGNVVFHGTTQDGQAIYAGHVVPEPSTLVYLAAAVLCLAAFVRRRLR